MISESIKVFLRSKPLRNTSTAAVFDVINESTCKFKARNGKEELFAYDHVFTDDVSQEEVYDLVARPVVEKVCRGYAGTLLAFGPTNSGKTYSMRGPALPPSMPSQDSASYTVPEKGNGSPAKEGSFYQQRGIIPRCIEHILSTIGSTGSIHISYLQIYCEVISDLLAPMSPSFSSSSFSSSDQVEELNASLSIRERDGCVFVEGLRRLRVSNVQEVLDILTMGDANRSTACTNLNEFSSRSHAAVMITVSMPEEETEGEKGEKDKEQVKGKKEERRVRESSLVLVDLAGSER